MSGQGDRSVLVVYLHVLGSIEVWIKGKVVIDTSQKQAFV
jgi:hypothetical protein